MKQPMEWVYRYAMQDEDDDLHAPMPDTSTLTSNASASSTSFWKSTGLFCVAVAVAATGLMLYQHLQRKQKQKNEQGTQTDDISIPNQPPVAAIPALLVDGSLHTNTPPASEKLPHNAHGEIFPTKESFELLPSAAASRTHSPSSPRTPPNSEASITPEALKENGQRLFQQVINAAAPAAQSTSAGAPPKENTGWYSYLPWPLG